jgi:hypothetical protein
MRKIVLPGQSGQKSLQDSIPMESSWAWWGAPVIPAMVRSVKSEDGSPGWSGQKQDPISKIARDKRAG